MNVTSFPSETTPFRVQLAGRYSPDGKRKTRYFASRPEAEKFVKNVKKLGLAAVHENKPVELTSNENDRLRVAIQHAAEKLGTTDPSVLYAAIEHYKQTRLNIKPATVREAVEAYHVYRQALNGKQKKAVRTIESDRQRLVQLIRHDGWEGIQLANITTLMFREFFAQLSPGTRVSVYTTVRTFISWAVKYKYLGQDPLAEISKTEDIGEHGVNNEYYKDIDAFGRMLRITAGLEPIKSGGEVTREYIDLLPALILGGFAGLRTCEHTRRSMDCDAVRWTDLYFDAEIPNLEVRESVAKQSDGIEIHQRHIDFEYAIEALKAWLPLVPQDSPFIVSLGGRSIQQLKGKFSKATGIKFLKNGLRNSFATYSFGYSGLSGLGAVAKQLGNSEAIAHRHYTRNLPTGSGKAWFDLRPFETVASKEAAAA